MVWGEVVVVVVQAILSYATAEVCSTIVATVAATVDTILAAIGTTTTCLPRGLTYTVPHLATREACTSGSLPVTLVASLRQ